jgi:hypothetical protein
MEMMKIIGKHKNIINLLGACTQDGKSHTFTLPSNPSFRKAENMFRFGERSECFGNVFLDHCVVQFFNKTTKSTA